jgi:hypothetical protein
MGFSIEMFVLHRDIGALKRVGETSAIVAQGIFFGSD